MTPKTGRAVLALAAALALSACGERTQDARQVITAVTQGLFSRGEPGTMQVPQFSRAAIEETGEDFILAAVPQRGVAALMQRGGQNGAETTWLTQDGVSATFENGFLVATRGLGPDLMAANVSQSVAAMRQGGGTATRVHEYLDGNDQIVRHDYACTVRSLGRETIVIYEISYATEKFEESCQRGGQTFANTYWVDSQGVVWKSRQLISPPVGYLDTERL